ncbi:winged helix-turn-helix domain-containing protein [Bdellovibrio svalbardensis]|nr:helix-turn-helix domain-containing protein [Bdellovibrio svalbardensis]
MKQTTNHLIKIAQLEYQKGHFMEASVSAKTAAQDSLSQKNFSDWLEAARILLLANNELDSLLEFEALLTPLQQFEKDSEGPTKASAQYLLAHYLLIKNSPEAETAIANSISTGASTQNLECLARSLALASFFYAREANKNLAKSVEYLDKLDIMIQELSLYDLSITSLIYRSFINGERNQFERAQELIWQAYEKAQHHGHQLALPTILAQIARLQKQQNRNDLFQMYSELALRGVSAQRHPRLYRQISEFCSYYSGKPVSAFDFVLDESQSLLRERDKGYIDFRNQHILLELAILFLKNPGMRYSKEDLIEIIWKQAYDPDIHDNLIYVSIKRLRLLMEPNSESPKYILRDRKGYYLNAQTQIQVKTREEHKV